MNDKYRLAKHLSELGNWLLLCRVTNEEVLANNIVSSFLEWYLHPPELSSVVKVKPLLATLTTTAYAFQWDSNFEVYSESEDGFYLLLYPITLCPSCSDPYCEESARLLAESALLKVPGFLVENCEGNNE